MFFERSSLGARAAKGKNHNGSIQYDGSGSTVAITNTNGTVVNKYAYDDFGNVATNSVEGIANPFKYVGQYGVQTDASDLLYMRARYYKPSIGRFINKDPIGFEGGINHYNYVEGNPISWIDPLGLLNPNGGPWGKPYSKADFEQGVKDITKGLMEKYPELDECDAEKLAREIMRAMTISQALAIKSAREKGDNATIEKIIREIYDKTRKK